jgi:hypothetical protein
MSLRLFFVLILTILTSATSGEEKEVEIIKKSWDDEVFC